MRKVTRTIQCPVLKYLENGVEIVRVIPGGNETIAKQLMEVAGVHDYVFGYMPVTYGVTEEDFIDMAAPITDIKKGKIYASKKECPTTTVIPKSDKAKG